MPSLLHASLGLGPLVFRRRRNRQARCAFCQPLHLLTSFAVAFAAQAAPLPRQVDIPSGNGFLHAQLYKPDGNGPFPVVIALHGCSSGELPEPVLPRYRDWAEQLLKAGDAVLLPDSYGSRPPFVSAAMACPPISG